MISMAALLFVPLSLGGTAQEFRWEFAPRFAGIIKLLEQKNAMIAIFRTEMAAHLLAPSK